MARAKRESWSIVALDIGVDTSTLNGELVANIIMSLAQWERQLIGQRVRAALDIAVDRGTKLGRPTGVGSDTIASIVRQRAELGRSYQAIADALNEAGIPTPQGGASWRRSTIRHLYERATAEGTDDV
jgi:DNA invertase Pin-like site-specific DNA recombinase